MLVQLCAFSGTFCCWENIHQQLWRWASPLNMQTIQQLDLNHHNTNDLVDDHCNHFFPILKGTHILQNSAGLRLCFCYTINSLWRPKILLHFVACTSHPAATRGSCNGIKLFCWTVTTCSSLALVNRRISERNQS